MRAEEPAPCSLKHVRHMVLDEAKYLAVGSLERTLYGQFFPFGSSWGPSHKACRILLAQKDRILENYKDVLTLRQEGIFPQTVRSMFREERGEGGAGGAEGGFL